MDPIFLDVETVGLTGPCVLIQHTIGSDKVQLYNPWFHTIQETIDLFEMFASHKGGIVGFNIVFDWFMIYKMWAVLNLLPDKDEVLEDCIELYAELEPRGRDYPYCLKPQKALDLLLHARKTEYQATMDRSPIRVRRVPTVLAAQVRDELEKRVQLKKIFFAKKKENKDKNWQIYDTDNEDFKDIVLRFAPSAALKVLAVDALGVEEDKIVFFQDIEVPKKDFPTEFGYAPFAKAVGDKDDWNHAWPDVISKHIVHWQFNEEARKYAEKDVIYTRDLYKYFNSPELGDIDSELAICVACCRWKGYKIDIKGIEDLREKALAKKYKIVDNKVEKIPISSRAARRYITHELSSVEQAAIAGSTKKIVLEQLSKTTKDCDCVVIKEQDFNNLSLDDLLSDKQFGEADPSCKICGGTGEVLQLAAIRAKEILDARQADKERELYDKLLLAGRFQASFKVIGALSGRMSGADGLNPQGIAKTKQVRSKFTFAFDPYVLCAGDFDSFEVSIAEAVFKDPKLREDLLSKRTCHVCKAKEDLIVFCKECNGTGEVPTSIHALFGTCVYPDMTYEQILATKGTSDDRYTRSKSAVFALLYFGTAETLQDRLGVNLEDAKKAEQLFYNKYPGVRSARQKVIDSFQSITQPNGIGTRVIWKDPVDYIETEVGFRRYFTLENKICKALFDLANKVPKEWQSIKVKVQRRDREQTVSGAVQSALYSAAFTLQASNTRAAGNHLIQSYGATITKDVQNAIWQLQPSGVHKWLVQPMNCHDEILVSVEPEMVDKVKEVVDSKVESYRDRIPLIKMAWKIGMKNWGEK